MTCLLASAHAWRRWRRRPDVNAVSIIQAAPIALSQRLHALQAATAAPLEFLTQSEWARRRGDPTIVDAGDEVLFVSPPWFFYAALIVAEGGVPVRVCARADDFDLDLTAIEAAITPRTRAIILNSPNNPTGRIYPPRTLAGIAKVLTRASQRHGH